MGLGRLGLEPREVMESTGSERIKRQGKADNSENAIHPSARMETEDQAKSEKKKKKRRGKDRGSASKLMKASSLVVRNLGKEKTRLIGWNKGNCRC